MIQISQENFGTYVDETGCSIPVVKYTLSNGWLTLQVITYGATITSLKIPDQAGILDDIVLGFDSIEDYYKNDAYIGATIGRVANRIASGKFILCGKSYTLNVNNPPNHLHGGLKGYDKVNWDSCIEEDKLILSYTSKDGEEGYPGEVKIQLIVSVTNNNEVVLHYKATTTASTPLSLTNHSYFNLSGHIEQEPIYDHFITVNADSYTPVNENLIPTGIIKSVNKTIFDLRTPVQFGERFKKTDFIGFDHNFCIFNNGKIAASLYHPKSGRQVEVITTMPGMQLYTANFLPTDNTLKGKNGIFYKKHGACCLETQHYPNAVNQPNFPSCVLHPCDCYDHTTVYKFSVK